MVALLCALAASTIDQDRLRSSHRGQYAFLMAAALLIFCIPLLALDSGGAARPVAALGLAPPLVGAAVLTGAGRRCAARTGRRSAAATTVGLYPNIDRSLVTQRAVLGRLATRAVPVRVPVLLVSVAGDRHLVELNQN